MTLYSRPILRAAAALAVLLGCGSGTGLTPEMALAGARWAERQPASYRITVTRSCECLPEWVGPVVVTVRDGAIKSRHYVASGAPVADEHAGYFPDVDGLFDIIRDAARDGVARLDVTYDPTFGYPTRIAIDRHANYVDDEIWYYASDFEVM